MTTLGPLDHLPYRPSRVLVGGTSGSGKTTLAKVLAARLDLRHTELDALHHGPDWTVRPTFLADVEQLAAQPQWITEYQYPDARPLLLDACDLVVYLAMPRAVVMRRVVARTVRRSARREVLWNGNVEPPLWTIFTDPDHIIRWAWQTHRHDGARIASLQAKRPNLPVVILRTPRDVATWLAHLAPTADS